MKRSFGTLLMCALFLAACGGRNSEIRTPAHVAAAWQPVESPTRVVWDLETQFDSLPLEGEILEIPWSDDYWADSNGGIGRRWLQRGRAQNLDPFLNAEHISELSQSALNTLSPAEKLDLIRGDFSFSTRTREARRVDRIGVSSWEGLCHGWANAALNFREPKAIIYQTTSGLKVPLASSDVKAMLTWYQAESNAMRKSIGNTCPYARSASQYATHPDCNDINAGTFHLVLANRVGLQKVGVVMDVVPEVQVWNHPVYYYKSVVKMVALPSANASPDAVKSLLVETTMRYGVEAGPFWGSGTFSKNTKEYKYTVELDVSGNVVGGEWMGHERPDTMWYWERPKFSGEYAILDDIYKKSIAATEDATRHN